VGRQFTFEHDPAGRMIAKTLADGSRFVFSHDSDGHVVGFTPPGRPEHRFSYNANHTLASYTPPEIGGVDSTTRFTYDNDRNVTRIDRPDGGSVLFQYEPGSCHLSTVNLGSRQRSYLYDPAGQAVGLNGGQGVLLQRAYDGGLLTNATWSGVVTGRVDLVYNHDFRLVQLGINGGDPVAIIYDPDGLPIQAGAMTLQRANETGYITNSALEGFSDASAYNGFGEPVSYVASHNGAPAYEVKYARDRLSRVSRKTETSGGVTRVVDYTYDLAGRLSEVRHDGALVSSYAYDATGNLIGRTTGAGAVAATYDAQERVVQFGQGMFEHGLGGERLRKQLGDQITRYDYDGLGNLMGVSLPNGQRVQYLLDAQDRRVGKRVDGVLVQAFLYENSLRPIAELNGAGVLVSRFVYATRLNVPDYMIKAGIHYRIVTDQLGSPRLVLNTASGQVVQRLDYDEFGRITLDSNPGFQPFGFAGGIQDLHTGLIHFGGREYDPETCRWTTKDPIGFRGGGNLYVYVSNDPINLLDPSGLLCLTTLDCACLRFPQACAEAAIIGGTVAAAATRAAQVVSRVGAEAAEYVAPRICPLVGRMEAIIERAPEAVNQFAEFTANFADELGAYTDQFAQIGEVQGLSGVVPQAFSELEIAWFDVAEVMAEEFGISLSEAQAMLAQMTGFDPLNL
jgi:RHS repeat-associated protein